MENKFKLPEYIEKRACDYMNEILLVLKEMGLLESINTASLDMLAQSYSMFITSTQTLIAEGLTIINKQGNIVPHPAVKIAKDSQIQAINIMRELGLTPLSKKKLSTKEQSDYKESPFEQFIANAKEFR